MIKDISNKIKQKLEWLTSLATVYDTIEPNKDWYPAVMFEPNTLSSEVQDTCNNLRTISFEAVLIQEIENVPTTWWVSKRKAWLEILETAYSDIINAFDEDFTLWWLCDGWVSPTEAQFWEAVLDQWDILFVKFNIQCSYTFKIK